MRRTLKFLTVATAVVLPSAAHAQACTPAQLAANPLVGMGYHAFVRINSSAFDLSCYFNGPVGGTVSFGGFAPSVSVGSGSNQMTATVSSAAFDYSTTYHPVFDYGVAGVLGKTASATDFAFIFTSPFASPVDISSADAQVGVTRAAGNPLVTVVTAGSPTTVPAGGFPAYAVGQPNFISVSGGGNNANPFANDLVNVGSAPCTTGTACAYAPASASPNVTASAWGTAITFNVARTQAVTTNAQVNGEIRLTAVPEPATLTLMGSGLLALVGAGYSRRRRA